MEVLDELFASVKKKRPYLELREERISKKIYYDEIVMAELDGHYTIFYLSSGERMRTRMTVRELAKSLTEKCFLECYRNVLVNLDYVEQVKEGKGGWEAFVMKGGHNALIQRTKTQSGPSVFYGLSVLEDGERGNAEWLVIM